MFHRTIQRTAGGTYVVTLPKEYVKSLGLDRKHVVKITLEDDRIILHPTGTKPVIQSKTIRTADFRDPKLLGLAIVNFYIMGHDIAEVVSEGKMTPAQKKSVREAVENLIGVEIVEDYADRVVLQSLVDPSKFEIDVLLERFTQFSRAIMRDAAKALSNDDKLLARDAYERGVELTRQYRLMMRICFQALRSSTIRETIKVGDVSSLVVRIIAVRELGRVAYYCMKMAERVEEAEKSGGEISMIIDEMVQLVDNMLEDALQALLKHDLGLASEVIDKMENVRNLYAKAYKQIIKKPEKEAYTLGLIIRAVRAIAGYSVALADDAILEIFSK
ncbi:MAG: phosphate uptake regulator PhoU [Candidatus Caldarchaeum sp.]|uniref:Phosphate uptake regulator PhoU n=1 Tax=Caldiarchaeum subterraneum TaxID=311458 RepID=A0A7C5U7U1_CALS0